MLDFKVFRSYEIELVSSGGVDPTYHNQITGNFREIAPSVGKAIRATIGSTTQNYLILGRERRR